MRKLLSWSLVLLMTVAPIFNLSAQRSRQVSGTYLTWDADMINIEKVTQTGKGVYVAVLDTGLTANWRDYFPEERIAEELGTGFVQNVTFKAGGGGCEFDAIRGRMRQTTFIGSRSSTHGTHVTSTIIGYNYDSNTDTVNGFSLPPIYVRGIAPDVTIIPVRVLADYQLPSIPNCPDAVHSQTVNFGTDEMIAAGIRYVTQLKKAGYSPMVINMSLGGGGLADVEKAAVDEAIAAGVIIVAAAGNEGEEGMHYPGAYSPVISAGAVGWTHEWVYPDTLKPRYRMWWLQHPLLPAGSGDVTDPTPVSEVYVTDFSSREITALNQELDVLAPGSWVRGPFPGFPGYSHLPWWSKGKSDVKGGGKSNYFYVGGTSMATPHVSAVAALMLEKCPALTQAQVEMTMRISTLAIPSNDSRNIYDINGNPVTVTWDTTCGTLGACDPVGWGLLLADQAIANTP